MLDNDSDDDFDGFVEENYASGNEGEDDGDALDSSLVDSIPSTSVGPGSSSSGISLSSIPQFRQIHSSTSGLTIPEFEQTPGSTQDMTGKNPVDFLQLFVTESVLENIVDETNKYADQYMESTDLPPRSRARSWRPCSVIEMMKFVAIIIAMSVDSKRRIEDYWSTAWPFVTKAFSSIMPRDRFQLLLRFFHLNDSNGYTRRGQPGYDALYKIRPLMESLISSFKAAYQLRREIAIDESMIGFKGRVWFIQYLPKKPTKWGMKAYVLADSVSGYTYDWKLYAGNHYFFHLLHILIFYLLIPYPIGRDDSLSSTSMSVTESIVVKLAEGLEHLGHHLYCDNFYTSPNLFLILQRLGIGACGTVRVNRKGIPATIKSKDKMKKGEITTDLIESGLVIKWMDKRPVTVLTNIHDDTMTTKRRRTRASETGTEEIDKPTAIAEYNTYMGGVDKADQLLSYYTFQHRTVKWWKRAAFHLLNMACVNAYIIYTETAVPGHRLNHELFLVQVAKGLLYQAGISEADLENFEEVWSNHPLEEVPDSFRLTGRHFNEELPPCSSGRIRQCVCICCNKKKGRKKVTTRYRCKICRVALCPTRCFELYHTKVDPTRYLPTI